MPNRLFGELQAKRLIGKVTVTTDDGSAGQLGQVTDPLPSAIERLGAEIVYACGPMAMLAAVGEVARAHGPGPGRGRGGDGLRDRGVHDLRAAGPGDDGLSRFVRSCVEGPVFAAGRVRWADVATCRQTSATPTRDRGWVR